MGAIMRSEKNVYSGFSPLERNKAADLEKRIKKRVVIICSVLSMIILISGLGWFWWSESAADVNRYAHIYQNGSLLQTIDLATVSDNYTFTINGDDDSYNVIEVNDQKIHIIDANCPDLVCVQTGYGQNNFFPITCLPNRLIIKVTSQPAANSNEDDVDAVAY